MFRSDLKRDYNIDVNFERAKHLLEENDGAGNTFKATAKPVLDRNRSSRRHDHDLFNHHGADRRSDYKQRPAFRCCTLRLCWD